MRASYDSCNNAPELGRVGFAGPTVGVRVIDADARFVRQVRAPAGRLCLPRQTGDELVPGVEQFLLVDDVVAVEDGAALVPGQEHGDPLGHAGADQGAGGGAAAIVEKAGG